MRSSTQYLLLGILFIAAAFVWLMVYQTASPTTKATKLTDNNDPTGESIDQNRSTGKSTKAKYYVPILMYHYIRDYQNQSDPLGIQLSVAPDTLDNQLSLLTENGYETISLTDFADGKVSKKSIILTFDDGYADHLTDALPILQKHQMTATFFIVSNFIGRDGYLTQAQINELEAAGMEIGGHSASHPNLANATFQKAFGEIGVSLRNTSAVFAYPSGKYSTETTEILRMLSVKVAVTTDLGVATDQTEIYELPRIRIKNHSDIIKLIDQEVAINKSELTPSQRTPD